MRFKNWKIFPLKKHFGVKNLFGKSKKIERRVKFLENA
jgi:hypothetical protein